MFLAISGSLRAVSASTELLKAAGLGAWPRLAEVPPFNPDDEARGLPEPVIDLRARIAAARAVVIATPEYAHGVPGSLKNALDWLVSGIEIYGKPVALWNPSAPSHHGIDSLRETLVTMGARVIDGASAGFSLRSGRFDAKAIAADPEMGPTIRRCLAALEAAAAQGGASTIRNP